MRATEGTKAIVIGAGIGGLSTAIALLRVGFDVAVYERTKELREVGSGLTLWVNAMRALDKLGVGDAIRAKGGLVQRLDNLSWQGQLFKSLPIAKVGEKYGAQSYGVHRGDLQTALAAALPADVLRLGAECTGFAEDADGVTVRFADGREERAALLVGADGINSVVRAQLHGASKPRYSGYTCWRSAARIEHPLLKPTVYLQLYGSGANFGIFPIGGGRWSWYGTQMTAAGGDPQDPAARKREALRQFDDWYEPVRAVIAATDESGFARQDIYDRVPIARWGEGRVTLVGDAAHPTTPALGQGGCMAIEDAVVLAKNLSLGGDIPVALRQYERQRRGRANGIVRQARRHGAFYHGNNRALGAARDTFFKTAPVTIAVRELEKLMGYEA